MKMRIGFSATFESVRGCGVLLPQHPRHTWGERERAMREGICVAGSVLVDKVYPIEIYPPKGELTTITEGITQSTGGALSNVIQDLARLNPKLPLQAVGLVGADEEGRFIRDEFAKYPNIDLRGLRTEPDAPTAFSFVMSENTTKQRTFFCCHGTNSLLSEPDFVWEEINARLLHIGYILLLAHLDSPDETYGTRMARLLARAQREGIKTSIDVVSEAGGRFRRLVPPALKYTDYCVINEFEAQEITGIRLRGKDGALYRENMPDALSVLRSMGVAEWAVIHAPEGGFGMNCRGEFVEADSLKLPAGFIKGTVGAGDAFCAGVLYAAYRGQSLREGIILGTASAACSLSHESATGGVRSEAEALMVDRRYRAPADI